MAMKDKLAGMKMPSAPSEEDPMMIMSEEDMMLDEPEMQDDQETGMDLTEASDEDLIAELEARGATVEMPDAESDEMTDDEMSEDDMEMA